MAIASGLDKHGGDSADPIAYAHCDMGGASVAAPFLDGVVTGNPVAAFVARYFLNL
jgi:leucyl aminopeptidase